jgi:hypothetical protein
MKTYRGSRERGKVWIESAEYEGRWRDLPLRLDIVNHSRSGFEWGYLGSGPAQLALPILCEYLGEPQLAVRFYEEFKEDVVARWKGDEWTLTEQEIEEWFNKAARGERLRLTREAITLERQLDSMYENESDFDFQRAEELNDRIIELSVQADELRRARRSGR